MSNWLERYTKDAQGQLDGRRRAELEAQRLQEEARRREREMSAQRSYDIQDERSSDERHFSELERNIRPSNLLNDIRKGPWRGYGKVSQIKSPDLTGFRNARHFSLGYTYHYMTEQYAYSSYYGEAPKVRAEDHTSVGIKFVALYGGEYEVHVKSSEVDTVAIPESYNLLEDVQDALGAETQYRMLYDRLPFQLG